MFAERSYDAGRSSGYRSLAQGLGWFSIALGAVELVAPGRLAEAFGLRGQENLIRAYGVREIGTGVAILASQNPAPWLWGRVGGDALDIATLGAGLRDEDKRGNAGMAIAAVLGVTALDVICAQGLQAEARERSEAQLEPILVDMRLRTGFPNGAAAAQVSRDEATPADFRYPAALAPWDAAATPGRLEDGSAHSRAGQEPLSTGVTGTSETDVLVEAADRIGGQDAAAPGLAARA